ncbi:MAG: peptide-methionine (S)-S-oxide reductase MsrA [Erythrobacter sp.]
MKKIIKRSFVSLAVASAITLTGCQASDVSAKKIADAPVAERVADEPAGIQTVVFAGGCFWCVEAVFSHTKGVTAAVSGYHGGSAATATYDDSNTGVTGHAEAVEVKYDPSVIRYDQLLQIFFTVVADPTLKNRQGPDVGPQYRAALVPITAEQTAVAAAYLDQMAASSVWAKPIVTEIEPYQQFYAAEDYHQDFVARNPYQGYVVRFSNPKVAGLKKYFPEFYRAKYLTDFDG